MSEQLDNELRKRISEVFEDYQDTAPSQEGWELLRQKFPEKSKRRMQPLWWSAAAAFLLFCTVGLWLYNHTQIKQTVVKNKQNIKPARTTVEVTQLPHTPPKQPRPDVNATIHLQDNAYANADQTHPSRSGVKLPAQVTPPAAPQLNPANVAPQLPYESNSYANKPSVVPQPSTTAKPSVLQPFVEQQSIAKNQFIASANPVIIKKPVLASAQSGIDTVSTKALTDQSKIARQQPVQKSTVSTGVKIDSATISKQKGMAVFLANEQKKERANQASKKDSRQLTDKKVLYNVYAATYFNYANGSSSQINTGAGFGTDIALSNHFKLSTGIAIGKNTLSYNGQPSQPGIQRDAAVAGDIAYNSSASMQNAFVTVPFTADVAVAGYNVSLTGLDVPVNIKYEFDPKNTDGYISAGLSSGTFINETYNYSYTSSSGAFGRSNARPDASTRKSFTNFDFARTLNLSIGMGYQITKSNRLIIEPFVKYPLSGLGSQQIRFGASGINLRLKFQTKK
jgi:hypothetical protein